MTEETTRTAGEEILAEWVRDFNATNKRRLAEYEEFVRVFRKIPPRAKGGE